MTIEDDLRRGLAPLPRRTIYLSKHVWQQFLSFPQVKGTIMAEVLDQLAEAIDESSRPRRVIQPDAPGWWMYQTADGGNALVEVTGEDLDEIDDWDAPATEFYGPLHFPKDQPTDDTTLLLEEVGGLFADRIKRFVELELEKRRLDQAMKECKARIAVLQPHLIEDFAEQGTQNVRCGNLTVYLNRAWYVSRLKGVEKQQLLDKLVEVGRGEMITPNYHASALKAWVLEQLTAREELQRHFAELEKTGQTPMPSMVDQLAEINRVIDPLLPLLNVGSNLSIKTRK